DAQRVAADELADVDLGIDDEGILELRIAALPTELGEAVHALRIQGALHARIGGQAGDAVGFEQALVAQAEGALATFGPGDAQAGLDGGGGVDRPRDAGVDLPVQDAHVAVVVAARGAGNVAGDEDLVNAVAVTEEAGQTIGEIV